MDHEARVMDRGPCYLELIIIKQANIIFFELIKVN